MNSWLSVMTAFNCPSTSHVSKPSPLSAMRIVNNKQAWGQPATFLKVLASSSCRLHSKLPGNEATHRSLGTRLWQQCAVGVSVRALSWLQIRNFQFKNSWGGLQPLSFTGARWTHNTTQSVFCSSSSCVCFGKDFLTSLVTGSPLFFPTVRQLQQSS